MTATATRTGGCQCGAVRYELTGKPLETYICHCSECRRQSASAFGISVIVRSADFHLVQGAVKQWSRPTASGQQLGCYFCPACGTRLWHGDKDGEKTISIKGGSMDDPVDLTGVPHIWTASKLPGIVIPRNALQYLQEPE